MEILSFKDKLYSDVFFRKISMCGLMLKSLCTCMAEYAPFSVIIWREFLCVKFCVIM
jgi:hypothetical protein